MNALRLLPLFAVGLVGCGPASVSGMVDGDRIGGAVDAIYDTLEVNLGPFGEVNVMLVILSNIPDSCQVFEDFYENVEPTCEDRCDGYMETAEDYLGGKEYWALNLSLVSNGSFEDTYDYEEGQLEDEEFQLSFFKYDAEPLYDEDACIDACEDLDLLEPDTENGNDGDLEILEEDGDLVRGRFEVDMGGDEGLRGSFTATECNMVDWLPWL